MMKWRMSHRKTRRGAAREHGTTEQETGKHGMAEGDAGLKETGKDGKDGDAAEGVEE